MFMDLLKQELGDSREAGEETRFNCPFCSDMKHKFYVNNKSGLWICFKCSATGNLVSFVMKYFMVDYMEAVDILLTYDYDVKAARQEQQYSLNNYGADLTEEERLLMFITRQGQPLEEERKIEYKCPAPPTNCKSLVANFNNPEAYPFFMYLYKRGVTLEQIKTHNISYVTYGQVELASGKKMSLVNHVVFFTFDENRKPIYWNTRSIEPEPFIKSFNGVSREGEYSKQNTVFNLNNAKYTDKIVICEGVFDALTVGESGVATFGKKVTDNQIALLLNETKERRLPMYIYLDADAWKEMIELARKLKKADNKRDVYFVYDGSNRDANDIGTTAANELINNAFLADSQGELRIQLDNM